MFEQEQVHFIFMKYFLWENCLICPNMKMSMEVVTDEEMRMKIQLRLTLSTWSNFMESNASWFIIRIHKTQHNLEKCFQGTTILIPTEQ